MGFLPLKKFVDAQYLLPGKNVCGIDEVGRGPWAGPLVAAALMFKKDVKIHGCADSKKLSADQREKILKKLEKIAVYGVGIATVEEIDGFGLTKATTMAYERALLQLEQKCSNDKNIKMCSIVHESGKEPPRELSYVLRPDFLLIDGRDKHQLRYPTKSVIKGDEKIKVIACASIVAKVARDNIMRNLAVKYPQYGFEEHKGYGTERHQQALEKYGVCEIHRKSFEPIAKRDRHSVYNP